MDMELEDSYNIGSAGGGSVLFSEGFGLPRQSI